MKLILKKNILPAFKEDVKSSLDLINRAQKELTYTSKIDFGFEAIIRYKDIDNLEVLAENLKACDGYRLSLHAPLNHSNPESVDLTTDKGVEIAEKLIEFSDYNNIELIVAHPNRLRPMFDKGYTLSAREEDLNKLITTAIRLDKYSSKVRFAIENKPYPATDEKNEGILYCPLLSSFNQINRVKEAGIPIVFDTAHYAIARSTIHSIIANKNHDGLGLFEDDIKKQPTISSSLKELGDSIIEIHLNDIIPYKQVNGLMTYLEAIVPERGTSVYYEDIIIFVNYRKTDLSILMEVTETDYSASLNAYDCLKDFIEKLALSS